MKHQLIKQLYAIGIIACCIVWFMMWVILLCGIPCWVLYRMIM